MTDILVVPKKKCSDIDITKPLEYFISTYYKNVDKSINCKEDIFKLQKLRESTQTSDTSETCLENLMKYYDQLDSIEMKIPENELNIPFKWKNAFDRKGLFRRPSTTIPSITFEKLCVLFNIGAIKTMIANSQKCNKKEEFLKASEQFLEASTIFSKIKENIGKFTTYQLTTDLQPECLNILSILCLAQSQEMGIQQTLKESKIQEMNGHDSSQISGLYDLIAKLSVNVDYLLEDIQNNMQKESVKNIWDKEWLQIINGKQTYYNGLSQFYMSRICKDKKLIGESISRLQLSIELFTQSQQKLGSSTIYKPNEWIKTAKVALIKAEKNNNLLYHKQIPKVKNLKPIEKIKIECPNSIPEKFYPEEKELFINLMPAHISQAIVMFLDRKNEIVNDEMTKYKNDTILLEQKINLMDLPAILDISIEDDIPEDIISKSILVVEAGGINLLDKLKKQVAELLKRNFTLLTEAARMMEDDQGKGLLISSCRDPDMNNTLESQYHSCSLTMKEIEKYLENAKMADNILHDDYSNDMDGIKALSGGESSLTKLLSFETNDSEFNTKLSMTKLLQNLESLKQERFKIMNQMKNFNPNTKSIFLEAEENGRIDELVIIEQILEESFAPLQMHVEENQGKITNILGDIQQLYNLFKEKNTKHKECREDTLKAVNTAYDAFFKYKASIIDQKKYYTNSIENLISFLKKVYDLRFNIMIQKYNLSSSLSTKPLNSAKQNLSDDMNKSLS